MKSINREKRLKYLIFVIPCWISRFFGVCSYSVTEDLKIKNSIVSRLYGAVIFIALTLYFGYDFHNSNKFYNDNYRKSIIYFEFILYWCASLSCQFLAVINQPKLRNWADQISTMLRSKNLDEGKLRKIFLTMIGTYGVGFGLVLTYSQLSFFVRQQPNTTYVAQLLYLGLCSNTMVILLQFTNGVMLVCVLFGQINEEMRGIFGGNATFLADFKSMSLITNEYKSYLIKEDEKNSAKIETVRDLSEKHHEYCVLATKLNDCFSLQILIFTALCFAELTYSTYYLISSITEKEGSSDGVVGENFMGVIAFSLSWAVFYGSQMSGCAVSCRLLTEEANDTGLLIHNILNKENDRKIRSLLEIFSLQIHQWKLEMTAFGFFPIDNSLLYTMVGSVTSALVILIQFRKYSSSTFSVHYYNFYGNTTSV